MERIKALVYDALACPCLTQESTKLTRDWPGGVQLLLPNMQCYMRSSTLHHTYTAAPTSPQIEVQSSPPTLDRHFVFMSWESITLYSTQQSQSPHSKVLYFCTLEFIYTYRYRSRHLSMRAAAAPLRPGLICMSYVHMPAVERGEN